MRHTTPYPLDVFPYTCTLTTRVSDVDGHGHLNAVQIGNFYETARAQFNRIGLQVPKGTRTYVVEMKMNYLAQAHWPGDVTIGTGISHIGTSSYHLAQSLFQNGACFGSAQTVLVHTDGSKPSPLSSDLRSRLKSQLLSGLPTSAGNKS